MSVRFSVIPSSGTTTSRTSKAWSRRDRDFSYSTLVGTEEFTTIQTYFADDVGYTFQALSPFESECKRLQQAEPGFGAEQCSSNKCNGAIDLESDTDVATIMSGDVPRVEGKTRRFRQNARRQIAVAMARARNGWIHFMYKLSGMRRHGKLVVPPKCFS
ncbi:hypothetical protein IW138_004040 [Coemansia sp. RSA 986]|nr:hypothetical protein IW138_004040 [Coemansia sp. RSA 986]